MMKSDPHYERLRDPRDKEIERLRAALECVKRNTETRHIETLRAAKENMQSAWIAATTALVPPNDQAQARGRQPTAPEAK